MDSEDEEMIDFPEVEEDDYEYFNESNNVYNYSRNQDISYIPGDYQVMTTTTANIGEIGALRHMGSDNPEVIFNMKLNLFLNDKDIKDLFEPSDTYTIVQKGNTLSFISRRNPYSLVLGYYLFKHPKQIKYIEKLLKLPLLEGETNMFQIVKYQRFWRHTN